MSSSPRTFGKKTLIQFFCLLCLLISPWIVGTGCAVQKGESAAGQPSESQSGPIFQIPPHLPDENDLHRGLEALETSPNDPALQLRTGILYQQLSQPDRWSYLDEAITLLTQATQALPENAEGRMYLGLSKAAKAKDPDVGLLKKLGLARAGFAAMDEAINLDPDNLSLRLLRAKASLIAPGLLGRSSLLKEDRAWIAGQTAKTEEVPLHLLAMSFIFLGDHAHRISRDSETAQAFYHSARKAGRGTPWEEKAQNRLDGVPSEF